MAVYASKWSHALFIYMILFHLFKPIQSTGVHFKLISGSDVKNTAADTASLIGKEFFQCGGDQSCTHVVRSTNGYTLVHGRNELERRAHEAEFIYEKMKLPGKSDSFFHYIK